MKLSIQFHKFGIAGEVMDGVVVAEIKEPVIIEKAYVRLEQNDYVHLATENSRHKYCNSSKHEFFSTPSCENVQVMMFECKGFHSQLFTEYAPGVYYFPFEFVLPANFPPTFVIPDKKYGYNYFLVASVYSIEKEFTSPQHEFTILYNNDVPNVTPVTMTKSLEDLIITLNLNQTSYRQGDLINCKMTVIQPRHATKAICVSLISAYTECVECSRVEFSEPITIDLPSTIQSIFEIQFPVSYKVTPSINNPSNSLYHYISVEIPKTVFHKQICFPVKIIANRPPTERIAEYSQHLQLPICCDPQFPFYDGFKEQPPQYPITIQNGIEAIQTSKGDVLYLNHFKRIVSNNPNGDQAIDIPYPLWKSITLPPGYTYGLYHNKECVFDHINRTVQWTDPFESNTQSALCDCVNACLSIFVIEAYALKSRDSNKPPTVYACVRDKGGLYQKTPTAKGLDPVFPTNSLYVSVGDFRKNVIVYLFDKKTLKSDDYLGSVNIDLTKLPFSSLIEGWFDLHNSPFGDEAITGKLYLKIGYGAHKTKITDFAQRLLDFSSLSYVPYYPPTKNTMKQVEEQNGIRRRNLEPIYVENIHGVIMNSDYNIQHIIN
ncbi:C2 domain-containing protein [Entamoeba marina]